MSQGRIFSIEEFSVFDGPGIRTTVFLKGCPLKCSWCHNPEGQNFKKEILRNHNGCINCGKCVKKAIEHTGKRDLVEACISVCPKNLIRLCGTDYTPEDLCQRLAKNKRIYTDTDGGVTFSGGEPLWQSQFLIDCLSILKEDIHIHTAIQTSGYCNQEIFKQVLHMADMFLFDLKIMNSELAKKYTGVSNEIILENFDQLINSGKDLIVRIPLIPDVTATYENMIDIMNILKFYHIKYAEAMPYNKFAGSKYGLCGRKYMPQFNPEADVIIPTDEFINNGITLKII